MLSHSNIKRMAKVKTTSLPMNIRTLGKQAMSGVMSSILQINAETSERGVMTLGWKSRQQELISSQIKINSTGIFLTSNLAHG